MIADTIQRPESLLEEYLRGPEQLAGLLGPLPADAFTFEPGPGRWTIHEILLHLVDIELTVSVRLRKVLAEDRPQLPTVNQDAWAARLHYRARTWRRALQLLRQLREGNVEILRHVAPSDWSREGVHSERGPVTLKQLVERAIEHLGRHLKQMQDNLRARNDAPARVSSG